MYGMFEWNPSFIFYSSQTAKLGSLLPSKTLIFAIRSRFIFRQIGIWHSMFTTLYYSTRRIEVNGFFFPSSISFFLFSSTSFLWWLSIIFFPCISNALHQVLCNFALERAIITIIAVSSSVIYVQTRSLSVII